MLCDVPFDSVTHSLVFNIDAMGVNSVPQAGTLLSIRYLPASAVAMGGEGECRSGRDEIFLFTLQSQQ